MIEINDLLRWPVLLAAATILALVVLAGRYAGLGKLYSRREWLVLGQLAFVVAGTMLLIAVHNATDLPEGQFIYGRF